jgi:hypothetical protein
MFGAFPKVSTWLWLATRRVEQGRLTWTLSSCISDFLFGECPRFGLDEFAAKPTVEEEALAIASSRTKYETKDAFLLCAICLVVLPFCFIWDFSLLARLLLFRPTGAEKSLRGEGDMMGDGIEACPGCSQSNLA